MMTGSENVYETAAGPGRSLPQALRELVDEIADLKRQLGESREREATLREGMEVIHYGLAVSGMHPDAVYEVAKGALDGHVEEWVIRYVDTLHRKFVRERDAMIATLRDTTESESIDDAE